MDPHSQTVRWLANMFEDQFLGGKKSLEARAGIEPAHKGFADLSLTTWVPRLGQGCF